MKRKTNVPIAGDSPGGRARRYVLRTLAFLLVLLCASPKAKAYLLEGENLNKYVEFDDSHLKSDGYVLVTFPFYVRCWEGNDCKHSTIYHHEALHKNYSSNIT